MFRDRIKKHRISSLKKNILISALYNIEMQLNTIKEDSETSVIHSKSTLIDNSIVDDSKILSLVKV